MNSDKMDALGKMLISQNLTIALQKVQPQAGFLQNFQ
ncbi:hypothetical protein SAMN05421827_10550 [Pedobacter terrae]|uniref:Uncharacterized protein n=1 Tax=Pedobacter terrae TaxID=405671 RepID=A0A1G7T604_9SPHI|nr:hypothetical protein SAMN05421827_10550 [Pedobacter terrae]